MTKFSKYRRRTIAKVMETVGVAKDVTQDPVFDSGYLEFQTLSEEIMEIGAAAHVYLEQAKMWTTTSEQLAQNFNGYFDGTPFGATAGKYLKSNDDIANVVRKSVAIVSLEQCLNPLRVFCSERIDEIEKRVEKRNNLRIDYDTYRKRFNDQSKNGEGKLEATREKLDRAKGAYDKLNAELITEFRSMKQSKESLLLNQATAMMICQLEFHSRAADSLKAALKGVVGGTPASLKTEKSIEQFVRSGGPDATASSQAMTANRASFKIANAQGGFSSQDAVPGDRNSFKEGSSGGNPLFRQSIVVSKRLPPAPPAPGSSKTKTNPIAIATFPFEPREAGEVGFQVGDKVEVLEQDTSGWWVGISNGKRGQFPANYVQLQ